MFAPVRSRSTYQAAARDLGDRWLTAVRPIRILDAVRWHDSIEHDFLASGGSDLPNVSADTYAPIRFDVARKQRELVELERDVRSQLGRGDPLGQLLLRRCRQARAAAELLRCRGTPDFAKLARELFGKPTPADDAAVEAVFSALATMVPAAPLDAETGLEASAAAATLESRLQRSMADAGRFQVRTLERLSAHAAARGRSIRLCRGARFSHADVALLEVHEGWVHLGTTLNAHRQPVCEFLLHGLPATTATQEGLAVLCELLGGVCHASRLRRLHRRYLANQMADSGADFLDVYQFFLTDCGDVRDAYRQAARIFRGSLPSGAGPFAKDRTYALGLVRLLRMSQPTRLKLLLVGKTSLTDLPLLESLAESGLLARPAFLPPPFAEKGNLNVPFFRILPKAVA